MNTIALFYATLTTFVTGIIISNYSGIEKLATQIFIHIDAYSVGHITAKIILGVTYLCIPVVLYRLKRVKMDNSPNNPNNIIRIKKTLICLISIILISKII